MHLPLRPSTAKATRKFTALLAVFAILVQCLSWVPGSTAFAASTAAPAQQTAPLKQGDAIPPPLPGEKPTYDYGDKGIETVPDTAAPADGAKGAQPDAPTANPLITGTRFGSSIAYPSSTLNFTYTIKINPGPQTVILRSAIKPSSSSTWILDTANDRVVTLNKGTFNASNNFLIPSDATL